MMRNIHYFNLSSGADERRAIELWDGCIERRTLKLYDSRKDEEIGGPFEPAQFMNESLWPDIETAVTCWSQEKTPELIAAHNELKPMIIMMGGVRYVTP
jgi:hypothetical protein